MRVLNQTATITITGTMASTTRASRQLISDIKTSAVPTFRIAQVTSTMPHVTNSAMRPASLVTRDMIQPTGVRSKYEKDSSCK